MVTLSQQNKFEKESSFSKVTGKRRSSSGMLTLTLTFQILIKIFLIHNVPITQIS